MPEQEKPKRARWEQAEDAMTYVPLSVDQYGILTKEGARTARRFLAALTEAKKKELWRDA